MRQNHLLKPSVCLLDLEQNCMVIGMDDSFGYNPSLGINIISSSLVQTQLSEEPLFHLRNDFMSPLHNL
jgi:hypothetical protein